MRSECRGFDRSLEGSEWGGGVRTSSSSLARFSAARCWRVALSSRVASFIRAAAAATDPPRACSSMAAIAVALADAPAAAPRAGPPPAAPPAAPAGTAEVRLEEEEASVCAASDAAVRLPTTCGGGEW